MPPSLEAMEDLIKQRQVSISLSDVNDEEPFAHRIITLKSPDWSIEIGRGNSVDSGTIPGPDNAWFTSKVVSRHHATIKAHPRSMILTIEDNNSMHGTYLNGTTVKRDAVELLEGDEITFGTDIVRHSETFSPLKTRITYEWMEEDSSAEARPMPSRNTFTADYSDQDIFSDIDDEVEIVKSNIRQSSVEILSGRFTEPAPASSSTNSPGTNSVKSAGASSATTTRIDLSIEEDNISTKPDSTAKKSIKTYIDLEDSEEDDMDDYSEHFSVNDMEDNMAGDSEAEEDTAPKSTILPDSAVVTAEKSPRDPSPSDAALPALRSVPAPRIQSVPSLASLMPPPPPSFLSSTGDEPFRSSFVHTSPFGRGFCGTDIGPTPYQSPPPFTQSTPFGYDFTSMNPPSPVRVPSFTNYGSAWAYPSVQMPQPPMWTDSTYNTHEGLCRPNKRKADSISSDSEDDFDDEPEPVIAKKVVEEAPTLAQTPLPPFPAEPTSTKEPEAVIEATSDLSRPAVTSLPMQEGDSIPQISALRADNDEEMPLVETDNIEPPRKRSRIAVDQTERRGSTMRTVAKYAVTASAGAVVGAVGMIIGLASLPPDYFV